MNRFRTLAVIAALVMAAAGTSLAFGAAPVALFSSPDEPEAGVIGSAEPSPEPNDAEDEGDEDEDADEAPENDAEDVDPSPEPEHTAEPEESDEPEPADAVDDDGPESQEGEGHEGTGDDDVDHHAPATIVSFDAESGLLTVEGSAAQTRGLVTSETELEWESRGEGPGRCFGAKVATIEDLTPGTRVTELTFFEDEHLKEVALMCPSDDGENDAETPEGGADEE